VSDQHESRSSRWLSVVAAGPEALLSIVLGEVAEAPAGHRSEIVRSFVAFVMGPRVPDTFARAVMRRASDATALETELVRVPAELDAVHQRRQVLEQQLAARTRTTSNETLRHRREQLLGDITRKRQHVERLRSVLTESRADAGEGQ
jgi:hypothetical protein